MKNFYKKRLLLIFSIFFSLLSIRCVKKITRVNSTDIIDISGRWNDTDARITAEEMIINILQSRWLKDFHQFHNNINLDTISTKKKSIADEVHLRKPVIVVGSIRNKGFEHIESEIFIKKIELELINSGDVRIITNSSFRDQLRNERYSQFANATIESQKKFGKELGADYMMFGTINTIIDASEDDRVIYYQINLELVDLETGEIVWMGDKKIKKYRSKTGKIRNNQKGILPEILN